ncbi:MAG TPA: hypothetical protein VFM83_00865 [Gaiellaceae bacterium]|nr:hypothetical protein [Gaiellaceae bacterium]
MRSKGRAHRLRNDRPPPDPELAGSSQAPHPFWEPSNLVAKLPTLQLRRRQPQAQERTEKAIGVLQQLADAGPNPALILSLCDLYAETRAWDEIVDAAAGVARRSCS